MIYYMAFNFLGFKRPNFGSEILTEPNMNSFGLEQGNHKNLIQKYNVIHTKN